MTRQNFKPRTFDITGCVSCKNYNNAGIFQLCEHPKSEYRAERVEFHTIQHMRDEHGDCGLDKKLHRS